MHILVFRLQSTCVDLRLNPLLELLNARLRAYCTDFLNICSGHKFQSVWQMFLDLGTYMLRRLACLSWSSGTYMLRRLACLSWPSGTYMLRRLACLSWPSGTYMLRRLAYLSWPSRVYIYIYIYIYNIYIYIYIYIYILLSCVMSFLLENDNVSFKVVYLCIVWI